MSASLEFLQPGAAVSVQDLGRFGHRALGVPLAGAADPVLMACANALLGQAADLAVLELGLAGPSLQARDGPARVALVGDFKPSLVSADGETQQLTSWRSMTLIPGQRLTIGPCRSGVGYLALHGGVMLPPVLGSRSTYARAGLGGIGGRGPIAGDQLPCGPGQGPERVAAQPWFHSEGAWRVIAGPQQDYFDEDAWQSFLHSTYQVTRDADRMGLRLEGAAIRHAAGKTADIVSEAVAPGAIQVPGNGQPIVLGVDAQTIGGYAKIATLITADLPRMAHARPGTPVRFELVTREAALAARRAQAAGLAVWVRALRPLPRETTVVDARLYSDNLISGMIDARNSD